MPYMGFERAAVVVLGVKHAEETSVEAPVASTRRSNRHLRIGRVAPDPLLLSASVALRPVSVQSDVAEHRWQARQRRAHDGQGQRSDDILKTPEEKAQLLSFVSGECCDWVLGSVLASSVLFSQLLP